MKRKKIKVLSVRQPWAHLLINGAFSTDKTPRLIHKTIENRTWKTNYTGPLAIHAGQTRMGKDTYSAWRETLGATYGVVLPADRDEMAYGAIIGIVQLDNMAESHEIKHHSKHGRWNDDSGYAWIVTNPQPFAVPHPINGRLRLWSTEIPICELCGNVGLVWPEGLHADQLAACNCEHGVALIVAAQGGK